MQIWTNCLCFSTLACSCYGPNFNMELKEHLYLPYLYFHAKGLCFLPGGGGGNLFTFSELFQNLFSTVCLIVKQITVLYEFF